MADDDEEYDYDYGSDAEYDYGSDADENEVTNDEAIEIENMFYEGEDLKNENRVKAAELFEKVIELESQKGDEIKWRFKALHELVLLYYKLNKLNIMIDKYQQMLTYVSLVTRNECTDAINTILDTISSVTEVNVLSKMYELTLVTLKTTNNERLWFNTNIKLAKVYLDSKRYSDVDRLINELKLSCQLPNGNDDLTKGTYLLEIYCIEIQLCTAMNDLLRMKLIYPKTLNLNSAVSDPRIMGIIREEGGKMYMTESNWDDAYNELYEAFRNYQEAGNSRAKSCLKYVVLASMLALSDINPFAAREAKVYADDKEILAMSELRQSLEANDLDRFENILNKKSNRIIDEPFLMTYIQPLRRRMREQVLINLTKPYQKVTLKYLGKELNLNENEVELLLVDLILDERLSASIDQTNGYVILTKNNLLLNSNENKLLRVINNWTEALNEITESYVNRLI